MSMIAWAIVCCGLWAPSHNCVSNATPARATGRRPSRGASSCSRERKSRHAANGIVFYSFPAAVRGIIRESSQYARLQKQVMFAFSSKYALALYEMVQKRGNLKFKTSEEFPVDRFRALLGVEQDKLREFKHFKHRAIDPAVLEVNGLGEFGCKVEPVYSGRKVTAVRLSWWAKNLDERKIALNELRFSRVGRRARLKGEVVTLAPLAGMLPPPHPKT